MSLHDDGASCPNEEIVVRVRSEQRRLRAVVMVVTCMSATSTSMHGVKAPVSKPEPEPVFERRDSIDLADEASPSSFPAALPADFCLCRRCRCAHRELRESGSRPGGKGHEPHDWSLEHHDRA